VSDRHPLWPHDATDWQYVGSMAILTGGAALAAGHHATAGRGLAALAMGLLALLFGGVGGFLYVWALRRRARRGVRR